MAPLPEHLRTKLFRQKSLRQCISEPEQDGNIPPTAQAYTKAPNNLDPHLPQRGQKLTIFLPSQTSNNFRSNTILRPRNPRLPTSRPARKPLPPLLPSHPQD